MNTKTTHIEIIYSTGLQVSTIFKKITKQNTEDYLYSYKKTDKDDPNHKWICTSNNGLMVKSKFFKWIYNKDKFDKEKWVKN